MGPTTAAFLPPTHSRSPPWRRASSGVVTLSERPSVSRRVRYGTKRYLVGGVSLRQLVGTALCHSGARTPFGTVHRSSEGCTRGRKTVRGIRRDAGESPLSSPNPASGLPGRFGFALAFPLSFRGKQGGRHRARSGDAYTAGFTGTVYPPRAVQRSLLSSWFRFGAEGFCATRGAARREEKTRGSVMTDSGARRGGEHGDTSQGQIRRSRECQGVTCAGTRSYIGIWCWNEDARCASPMVTSPRVSFAYSPVAPIDLCDWYLYRYVSLDQ